MQRFVTHKYDNGLMENLINIPSPSGSEGNIAKFIMEYIGDGDDVIMKTDTMGNVNITLLGASAYPHIAFDAHIDEIGLMVMYVDDNANLHVQNIGGVDPAILPGMRFDVHTESGETFRAITARPAIKFLSGDEETKVPKIADAVLEVIADPERVKSTIKPGDKLTYGYGLEGPVDGVIVSRALDNKLGAYIGIKAFKELRVLAKEGIEVPSFTLNFSVQEEIGCRGTGVNAYGEGYDAIIVHDVTHAMNFPGAPKNHTDIQMREGCSISTGPNINPKVRDIMIACANEIDAEWQLEPRPVMCPNDSRALQIVENGIPVGLMSVPIRYMHSPNEVAYVGDIENAVDVLANTVANWNELGGGEGLNPW